MPSVASLEARWRVTYHSTSDRPPASILCAARYCLRRALVPPHALDESTLSTPELHLPAAVRFQQSSAGDGRRSAPVWRGLPACERDFRLVGNRTASRVPLATVLIRPVLALRALLTSVVTPVWLPTTSLSPPRVVSTARGSLPRREKFPMCLPFEFTQSTLHSY